MVLSKSEVLDWKRNKVTQAAFDLLDDQREKLKEHVITGGATTESVEGTAQLVAKCIGKAEVIDEILNDLIEMMLEEAVGDEDEN